jgi:hypothetical protein
MPITAARLFRFLPVVLSNNLTKESGENMNKSIMQAE